MPTPRERGMAMVGSRATGTTSTTRRTDHLAPRTASPPSRSAALPLLEHPADVGACSSDAGTCRWSNGLGTSDLYCRSSSVGLELHGQNQWTCSGSEDLNPSAEAAASSCTPAPRAEPCWLVTGESSGSNPRLSSRQICACTVTPTLILRRNLGAQKQAGPQPRQSTTEEREGQRRLAPGGPSQALFRTSHPPVTDSNPVGGAMGRVSGSGAAGDSIASSSATADLDADEAAPHTRPHV